MKSKKLIKPLILTIASLCLIVPAEAGKDDKSAKEEQKEKEKKKELEKEARENKRKAVQDILDAKDKNHDGSLSREEYLDGEADAEAASKVFDQFNKNRDRALSKTEIAASLGL